MKVFIPFTVKDIGGTSIFARKFQQGMEQLGHEVFFDHRDDYDLLLIIVQAPFKYILEAKRKGVPIIQRLDGVYYWSVASWRYPLLNLKAAITRHFFARFSIYQSRYSKYCVDKFLGKKKDGNTSTIIYNGVDTTVFSPKGKSINLRDNANQRIFFTASEFRRKDQLLPLIEALKIYEKKYTDNYKFVISGTFSRELSYFPKTLNLYPKIQYLGKITNAELPTYERSADVFLFSHLNPPCPNNVIEAMACGLPICGIADGAMPEIVVSGDNGLLVQVLGDAFWNHRHIDTERFADNIDMIARNQKQYSEKSYQIAETRFSLNTMTQHYIEILNMLHTV